MAKLIKLFWWKDKPNFGDAISPLIVAHVSGRPVDWAAPEDCDLFATGSLMKFVRRASGPARRASGTPWIWGTGTVGPMRIDFLPHVRIASVRGPLTAEVLMLGQVPQGDPALLLPRMVEPVPEAARDGIGIVAHHSKLAQYRDDPALRRAGVTLIDVTLDDPLAVVRRIAACRTVWSSSLHGLIVADAFGVENHWLDPAGIHGYPRFKFYDYAASVARGLPAPVASLPPGGALRKPRPLAYAVSVAALADTAAAAFPAELKR